MATTTTADPDLWGHVRFGQLATLLGGPVRHDPFSYLTTHHPWINHEWLSELLFARVWDHFHATGLILLKAGVVFLVLLLVYGRLSRRGPGPLRGGLIAAIVAIPSALGLGTIRPQMFTGLGVVLTLLILAAAEDDGRHRMLWLLPPLFAVWVNLHGGVLAGVGLLGVWTAARLVLWARVHAMDVDSRERGAPSLPLVLTVAVASLAALLLNPYGPDLPLFLIRTATVPRPDITEWQRLVPWSRLGLAYVLVLAGAAWTLRKSRHHRSPAITVLIVALAVLPFSAVRHFPLSVLGLGVLLAPDLGVVLSPRRKPAPVREPRSRRRSPPRWTASVTGALTGVFGIVILVRTAGQLGCIPIEVDPTLNYPARAIAVLEASGAEGNLATFFNYGEYAIWHLGPRLQVGMDGRRETVYPDSVFQAYQRWYAGARDWDRYLAMGPAELAIVPRARAVYNLMSLEPGWDRVYQDTIAAVFGRQGLRATARVREAAIRSDAALASVPEDGHGLCFPGPKASGVRP